MDPEQKETIKVPFETETVSEKISESQDEGTNGLKRDISTRQMLLMAAGGSIGAGLFVASGQALHSGGAGNVVFAFGVVGFMVSMTMASLGEMATTYPVAGAFYDYAVRFLGPQVGFAMGWNFAFNWMIVLPFELVTICAQLKYWNPDLHPSYFIAPFIAFLAAVSFKGAKWFAELEHWLGLCKVVAISAFICFALALVTAGVPGDSRGALGGEYWRKPGAFLNGLRGTLSVFRIAGMAYGGTELLGLTAAECRRPHRVMPLATKVVFFRVLIFYVGALLMLGLVVPADSPNLASVGHGAKYSPFVLAANLAGKPALGSFFLAMIVAALISMANTSAFASSRALQALCQKGMGPKIFATVSKKSGIPWPALTLAFILALMAFVSAAPGGEELFDWLLSLSAFSNYMTWAAICFSHIRMRKAMKCQGRSPADMIWKSPLGVTGSYVGLSICALGLMAQITVSLWPVNGQYNVKAVARDLLGIVWLLCLFGGYTMYCRFRHGDTQILIPLADLDLDSGRRDRACMAAADLEVMQELAAQDEAEGWRDEWPWNKKVVFRVRKLLGVKR